MTDHAEVRRDALRRTDEQMELIRGRFNPDGLLRLAHSTQDYYDQKGYYLPDVAALAYVNGCERDALLAEMEQAEQDALTAERERDLKHAQVNAYALRVTELEASVASVPALVEALRLLTDYGPPEDTSRWNAMDSGHRLALIQAREALTVYEQSQGNA